MSHPSGPPLQVATVGSETFIADELVVSLPYLGLLLDRLHAWVAGASVPTGGEDARLGLGLLRLDARAAVAFLESQDERWVAQALEVVRRERPGASDLDLVSACLRRSFADAYGGWIPTFGKNRVMSRLTGSYVIDGGGRDRLLTPLPAYSTADGQHGGRSGARRGAQHQDHPAMIPRRRRSPGSGTRVGVVDTRLAPHPWLAGGYVAPAAELLPERTGSPLPWQVQHATFVTGLILRQAPGAVVEVRSGLRDDASQDSWAVARTIAELAAGAADVVNLSLGCRTEDGRPPLVLQAALATRAPGSVVVAAAGNHGAVPEGQVPPPSWPAALDNVIAVGALDGDHRASFSPEAPWVDAMAPGVLLVSTSALDGEGGSLFAQWSGTSFAAAAVTGAIAAAATPAGSAQQAWDRLVRRARKDPRGRPCVEVRHLPGWPPDGAAAVNGAGPPYAGQSVEGAVP